MLTQDQKDLLAYLAERVTELANECCGAAAGQARAKIDEAEELMAIRAAILDRHVNSEGVLQLQLPLDEQAAA